MKKDHFAHKSKSWDMNSNRVKNAEAIANGILNNINMTSDMKVIDFGAGTGLLSYFIAPHVDTIIAIDNSPSMLEVFAQKCDEFDCKTEVMNIDLSTDTIDREFDGIISSMTIHHLEDIPALLSSFYAMLKPGGFIALADLDSEDGSFHSDNTGVYHFGFDRERLEQMAREAGFCDVSFETVSTIAKPHKSFTIFLLSAKK